MKRNLKKIEKYLKWREEISRLLQLNKVQVIPVVIGALGSVTKDFDK